MLLLPSKTTIPENQESTYSRSALLARLSDVEKISLILISAPAGFGKTTLVSQWIDELDGAVSWFSLDTSDSDTQQFACYLVESIHYATAGGCPLTSDMAKSSDEISLKALLSQLLAELHSISSELHIVLDNYHEIKNDEIAKTLTFFINHLPTNITLVVLSRTMPDLGVASLKLNGKLATVETQDLAFSPSEVDELLQQRATYPLDKNLIRRLHKVTEGWPTAIQLANMENLDEERFSRTISEIEQGHSTLIDYLTEQVFNGLTESQNNFLLNTCLLSRFNEKLVNAMHTKSHGQILIEQLDKAGLFIVPLDQTRTWFRYHSIFSVFLVRRLSLDPSTVIHDIHQRACEAWLLENESEQALTHAVEAEDVEKVRSILTKKGPELYQQGKSKIIQRCLDLLGEQIISESAALTLLVVHLAIDDGKYNRVESFLDKSETYLKNHSPNEWKRNQGEFAAIKAQSVTNLGQMERARDIALSAMPQITEKQSNAYTTLRLITGGAYFCLGDPKTGLKYFLELEELAKKYDIHHLTLQSLCLQSDIASAQGMLQRAYNIQDKIFRYSREHNLDELTEMEFTYRLRAQLMWEWNRIDECEEAALCGIEINSAFGEHMCLQGYSLLLKVALARGEMEECKKLVRKIEDLLTADELHLDWQANAHSALIDFWVSTGDTPSLSNWLQYAPPLTPHANNHFEQAHARNYARVHMELQEYRQAGEVIIDIFNQAQRLDLALDINRNEILMTELAWREDNQDTALEYLHSALLRANTTGCISSFLRVGKPLIVILKALQQESSLDAFTNERVQKLLVMARERVSLKKKVSIQLDQALIDDLLKSDKMPEFVKYTPLTKREWEVFKLIHIGLSNEAIAKNFGVANSTIKTHIRRLYRKLDVTNRKQAIELADQLLQEIQEG